MEHSEESGRKQFGLRMRAAMPRMFFVTIARHPYLIRVDPSGLHLKYIEAMDGFPLLNPYVAAHKDNQPLVDAYNNAVIALKAFRDYHVIIVATFVLGALCTCVPHHAP